MAPLLSISVPDSQTPGYWLHSLPSMPLPSPCQASTHSQRVCKWRRSAQCQEAARPQEEYSSQAQQMVQLQPLRYPPEFGLSMVCYHCVFDYLISFNIQPVAPFNYIVSLSKAPVSFLRDLKCLNEERAECLGSLGPRQTTNLSPPPPALAPSLLLPAAHYGYQSGLLVGLFCILAYLSYFHPRPSWW